MKNRQEISRLGVIGEEQGLEKEYFLFSNPRKNQVFLPEILKIKFVDLHPS